MSHENNILECQRVGASSKRPVVRDSLIKGNPDVVILQETKLSLVDRRTVKEVWSSRHKGCVTLDAVGASGGILMLWNEDSIEVHEAMVGTFSVSISFSYKNSVRGWLTGVYGPPTPRGRDIFLAGNR